MRSIIGKRKNRTARLTTKHKFEKITFEKFLEL